MSVCCADMMTAKVGPDAKPFVVQPLMEVLRVQGCRVKGNFGQMVFKEKVVTDEVCV